MAKAIIKFLIFMLAFLFLGAGIWLYINLDQIGKIVAERVASDAMGVDVTIGSLDVGVQDKRIEVRDVRIDNPAGYDKPHIITVDALEIQAGDLSRELVEFDDITASGTNVYVEVKSGTTNLHALRDQVDGIAQKREVEAAQTGSAAAQTKVDASETIKVILRKLSLSGATIHPSVTLIDSQDLRPLDLGTITLSGIGTRENGVLAKDAVSQISQQLLTQFNERAASGGFLSGLSADNLREMGVNQVRGIIDGAKTGNEKVDQVIDKVGDKLKGLF